MRGSGHTRRPPCCRPPTKGHRLTVKDNYPMSDIKRLIRSLRTAPHLALYAGLGLIATIAILAAPPCCADAGWLGNGHGCDIGGGPTGSDSYNSSTGTYTITGGGSGFKQAGDQMHVAYTELPAGGNFRLIARIAGFTGGKGSGVGLIVRQDINAVDSAACVLFQPATGTSPTPNNLTCFARNLQVSPQAIYPWAGGSPVATPLAPSTGSPSCWLQLVRYGNNFAVYKSADGAVWTGLGGSAYAVTGPIYVGFLVASGGNTIATATIDNVSLNTAPVLPYESSWLGNTLSSDATGYVSSAGNALWVQPDGTCYTGGFYDEAGECGKVYKNGQVIQHLTYAGGPFAFEGCIASDGTHLYTWGNPGITGVLRSDMNNSYYSCVEMCVSSPLTDESGCWMSGLACAPGRLYISDAKAQVVHVLDPELALPSSGGAKQNFGAAEIDTSGIASPVPPAAIYQKNRASSLQQYTFKGLAPTTSYNVRCHFAVIDMSAKIGKYLFGYYAGTNNVSATQFDPLVLAGNKYNKAIVHTLSGCLTNASGSLTVTFEGFPNWHHHIGR